MLPPDRPPPVLTITPFSVLKLSVQRYQDTIRNLTMTEDDPAELIERILAFDMPKNPPHRTRTRKLITLQGQPLEILLADVLTRSCRDKFVLFA